MSEARTDEPRCTLTEVEVEVASARQVEVTAPKAPVTNRRADAILPHNLDLPDIDTNVDAARLEACATSADSESA